LLLMAEQAHREWRANRYGQWQQCDN
jgi:hypothetical protein